MTNDHLTNQSPSTTTVTLPDYLARAAYDVRYLELFWDAYMPMKKNLDLAEKHATFVNPSWAEAANQLYASDEALRTALLALGLSTLGRQDGQWRMINEGHGAYVRSLKHVSKQLQRTQ